MKYKGVLSIFSFSFSFFSFFFLFILIYFFFIYLVVLFSRVYVRVYVDANETRVNKSCNRKIDECAFFFFFLIVRLFPRNYLLRLFYLRYWSPISFDSPFNFPYNFPVSINFPFPLTSLTFRFPFLQRFLATIAIEIFLNTRKLSTRKFNEIQTRSTTWYYTFFRLILVQFRRIDRFDLETRHTRRVEEIGKEL